MLGNEQGSQENGQNTELGLSSMGEQNQEQRQNTQQVEEVATNITEEEQVKINLERLNAYIEAKKQREQEQQVQVSQSEEATSNKEESKNNTIVDEQPQQTTQPEQAQETALLTALSTGTIKGVQNLKTSPLASFEGMTDLERVILSTNMEGLPDALRFISSDASFAGFTGSKATRRLLEMQTAKKYLDQSPKDNTLTISQTADVITNLHKLDNLKKEQ